MNSAGIFAARQGHHPSLRMTISQPGGAGRVIGNIITPRGVSECSSVAPAMSPKQVPGPAFQMRT
jgi:hypothetical protein